MADKLADLVFFHVGHRFEYDVELSLPARLAPPARLGVAGQLGWTSWVAPRARRRTKTNTSATHDSIWRSAARQRKLSGAAAQAGKGARAEK